MKRGFTLIELLVAIAIGSVVLTLLFNSFFQTTGIINRADDIISINTRASLVQHQLEKDIMGAFLPVQAFKEQDTTSTTTTTTAATTPQKKPPPKKEAEKKEKKKLTKAFYGINRGALLDVLTFITNNPISAYWSKQTGKAKPKIARVVYRLVEDKEQKGSFTLLRQEGTKLEFESYTAGEGSKGIRAYPLVEGIKEFEVKYKVIIEPEEKKEEPKKQQNQQQPPKKEPEKKEKKKKEIKFKTLDQWDFEKEMPKDIQRRIPNIVDVKLTLWNEQATRATSFEFSIPIIPEISEKPIKKPDQGKTDDKKTGKQPAQPGQAGSSPVQRMLQRRTSPTVMRQNPSHSYRSSHRITQHPAAPQQDAPQQDARSQLLRLIQQERTQS